MAGMDEQVAVSLRPWADQDLSLLQRMNTREMWAHLGGPEAADAVRARHVRYLDAQPGGRMFVITVGGDSAGTIGYWPREWQGENVHELGWMVLPEFQGRGVATWAGRACVTRLRCDVPDTTAHAFPSADHPPSNAVCRHLGFVLIGETQFEFPRGHWMRCNDWCLPLK